MHTTVLNCNYTTTYVPVSSIAEPPDNTVQIMYPVSSCGLRGTVAIAVFLLCDLHVELHASYALRNGPAYVVWKGPLGGATHY